MKSHSLALPNFPTCKNSNETFFTKVVDYEPGGSYGTQMVVEIQMLLHWEDELFETKYLGLSIDLNTVASSPSPETKSHAFIQSFT